MDDDLFDDCFEGEEAGEENFLDESFEEDNCWESDEEAWEEDEPGWSQDEEERSRLDLTDALILGTMITGNAYEEARLNRLISKSRK